MERKFRRILTPVDLGDSSIAPLHYTALLARQYDAQVTLLYADELAAQFATFDAAWIEATVEPEAEAKKIEQSLRDFASAHAPGLDSAAIVVKPDHPVNAIVRTAREIDADLIVMGTHGRRGWRRALVGSVADGVVRAASQPVLVVPESHDVRKHPEQIVRIVCPVNFTEAARDAVTYAASLATNCNAELILVHVLETGAEADTPEIQEYLLAWLGNDIQARCSLRALVLRGGPAERVLDCIEDVGADLLVIGAQVKWLRTVTVIGTTSERLLRFSPVPVLTVTRIAAVPVSAGGESIDDEKFLPAGAE
ncbi:MAG: universal stress protein [Thermoanaerobaculia bacterium]